MEMLDQKLDNVWGYSLDLIHFDSKTKSVRLELHGLKSRQNYVASITMIGVTTIEISMRDSLSWEYIELSEVRAHVRDDNKYDIKAWCWEEDNELIFRCASYEVADREIDGSMFEPS